MSTSLAALKSCSAMADATPLDEVCAWDDELEAAMRHRPVLSEAPHVTCNTQWS